MKILAEAALKEQRRVGAKKPKPESSRGSLSTTSAPSAAQNRSSTRDQSGSELSDVEGEDEDEDSEDDKLPVPPRTAERNEVLVSQILPLGALPLNYRHVAYC